MILPHGIGQLVECPNCAKISTFIKPTQPHIDTCGFESYTFLCEYCGSLLSGVVDPFDDQLLVSLLERHIKREVRLESPISLYGRGLL